ncbi:hypothetical protein NDU88_002863 [Pleurodeles waltl]|uniref:Uncharacterized protein n=1 Tax=Pleurodeles waltl TaxID=8319 RepID=A0AAV7W0V6_PLEWA|nr:hypothetical protein NDU88_002863 [Pleurodeles waltl]
MQGAWLGFPASRLPLSEALLGRTINPTIILFVRLPEQPEDIPLAWGTAGSSEAAGCIERSAGPEAGLIGGA